MRKKLIAIVDAEQMPDLAELMQVAIDFKIETVEEVTLGGKARHMFKPGKGKTSGSTIMEHFSPQGNFRRDTAMTWLTTAGYNKNTISSALLPLIRQGFVRDLGNASYQFVKPLPKAMPVAHAG